MKHGVQNVYFTYFRSFSFLDKLLELMAIPARLELATYCLEGSSTHFSSVYNLSHYQPFANAVAYLRRIVSLTESGGIRPISKPWCTFRVHFRSSIVGGWCRYVRHRYNQSTVFRNFSNPNLKSIKPTRQQLEIQNLGGNHGGA